VLPAVGEVVFVEETLAGPQAEVGQPHSSGIVFEAPGADAGNAVLATLDEEAVQVTSCRAVSAALPRPTCC
jgi:hypothetical protein